MVMVPVRVEPVVLAATVKSTVVPDDPVIVPVGAVRVIQATLLTAVHGQPVVVVTETCCVEVVPAAGAV